MIDLLENETSYFEEAGDKPVWVDAMVEEYKSIVNNIIWEVVPRPTNKSVLGLRWIFKVKHVAEKRIEKYKAKGFSQVEGIDYEETFSHAELKQPLYYLKQAPRAWSTRIDNYLTSLGFTKSEVDAKLYHIFVEGNFLIIVLYVDDLILAGDEQLIRSCKEVLAKEFEMNDMGLMHYFPGLEVWRSNRELFVSQGKYANEILQRFRMESCKPMETPLETNWRKEYATSGEELDAAIYRKLVGSLMYLVNT
eukprot:PITA_30637